MVASCRVWDVHSKPSAETAWVATVMNEKALCAVQAGLLVRHSVLRGPKIVRPNEPAKPNRIPPGFEQELAKRKGRGLPPGFEKLIMQQVEDTAPACSTAAMVSSICSASD